MPAGAGSTLPALEAAYTEMAARVAPFMTEICEVPLVAYPRFIALDRERVHRRQPRDDAAAARAGGTASREGAGVARDRA